MIIAKRIGNLPETAKVERMDKDRVLLEDEQGITRTIDPYVFKLYYEISQADECEECGEALISGEHRTCSRCASSREHAGDIQW